MKVVENTEQTLVLRSRSGWLAAFLVLFAVGFVGGGGIGLAFGQALMGWVFLVTGVLGGLAGFLFLFRPTTITLDREAQRIRFRSAGLLGATAKDYRLADFQRATTETRNTHDGSAHRCVLLFANAEDSGRLPVSRHFTSGASPARVAHVINTWHTGERAPDLGAFEV